MAFIPAESPSPTQIPILDCRMRASRLSVCVLNTVYTHPRVWMRSIIRSIMIIRKVYEFCTAGPRHLLPARHQSLIRLLRPRNDVTPPPVSPS